MMEDELLQERDEARRERDRWKNIALYLASCHAATAGGDGTLKSTSKSRRERLKTICHKAARMISGYEHAPPQQTGFERFVKDELLSAVQALSEIT